MDAVTSSATGSGGFFRLAHRFLQRPASGRAPPSSTDAGSGGKKARVGGADPASTGRVSAAPPATPVGHAAAAAVDECPDFPLRGVTKTASPRGAGDKGAGHLSTIESETNDVPALPCANDVGTSTLTSTASDETEQTEEDGNAGSNVHDGRSPAAHGKVPVDGGAPPSDGSASTTKNTGPPHSPIDEHPPPLSSCVCRFTLDGHRLRKRQREASVFVSRETVRNLAELLCSVFLWDALSLWRRELVVWASQYEASCWTRRAFVSVFVDDMVWPRPPPHSVVHRCRASAARIVGVFFDECDIHETRRCQEHTPEAMEQEIQYESHPFYYE